MTSTNDVTAATKTTWSLQTHNTRELKLIRTSPTIVGWAAGSSPDVAHIGSEYVVLTPLGQISGLADQLRDAGDSSRAQKTPLFVSEKWQDGENALPSTWGPAAPLPETSFQVHMINTFFQAPFRINRDKLHRCFLDNGFYSRLEPYDNAGVNLRYHYKEATRDDPEKQGRCSVQNKQACTCKDISVSCFNSGKMNVAGLANMEQGNLIYRFLQEFFTAHRSEIEAATQAVVSSYR
ncbi:uncharacterized protein EV422DRAFT_571353 [Fimicolochytrium jonesii]|uniref:uncharacterized protein n=1 Tax=Fimicolochytrium jonesii TaxID=1396493 RepID=UPI0022FE946B|nr:uncharacterized protein EV422DRAFT_571353 [Fimicolochytrium jonesii]KAI8816828.1 hypothetical protein EV422DRAFT_571353 [Fimicolochytrium jonesii]